MTASSEPKRAPAVVGAIRRLLSHRLSVGTMIEVALWLAIPHVVIGLGWAFTHPDHLAERSTQLSTVLPAGIDAKMVAIGETTLWWPVLALLPPDLCTESSSAVYSGRLGVASLLL